MNNVHSGYAREVAAEAGWQVKNGAHRRERLPQLVGLARDADAELDRLRLAIIGAGSVGLAIALSAARLQVGGLLLVDGGRYKMASLLTHGILPHEAAAALPKAAHAGRLCKQISPRTRVFAYDGPIQAMAMDALVGFDLVVLATDNVAAEIEAGLRCLRLRTPLVQAAVHGETLVAQVRFYRNADAGGACPACSLNRAEIEMLTTGRELKCDGTGAAPRGARAGAVPTRSTSCLCGLAADLAMIEILKYVLGLGPWAAPGRTSAAASGGAAPAGGTACGTPAGRGGDYVLEYAGYTSKAVVTPLASRASACVCDHAATWLPASPPRPLAACSLSELAEAAGPGGGLDRAWFTVDGMVFALAGVCSCGKRRRLNVFTAPGAAGHERCGACGEPFCAEAFFWRRAVAAEELKEQVNRPLREIGAAGARCVLVAGDDNRAVLFSGGLAGRSGPGAMTAHGS